MGILSSIKKIFTTDESDSKKALKLGLNNINLTYDLKDYKDEFISIEKTIKEAIRLNRDILDDGIQFNYNLYKEGYYDRNELEETITANINSLIKNRNTIINLELRKYDLKKIIEKNERKLDDGLYKEKKYNEQVEKDNTRYEIRKAIRGY